MSTYTVQIEAGNLDGTVWQAYGPSETIDDAGTAEDVAEWAANNQNVAYDNWRVLVWAGADADTSSPPALTLDSQQILDRQANAADVWERDREAYEAPR